ncbi:hypothetical protein [Shewanella colwelliana]|uniref:hypothetical protein n=1 Tax=Shewanella colwelliana TaxID=23 RepID=UPI0037350A02
MPLKPLFCRQGVDSSYRLLGLTAAAFFAVFLLYLLIGSHLFVVIVSLILAAIVGLSGYRRLQGQKAMLSVLPAASVALFALGLNYLEGVWLPTLAIVLAVAGTIAVVIRPQAKVANFDAFGYSGPLAAVSSKRRRVEPILVDGALDDDVQWRQEPLDEQGDAQVHHQEAAVSPALIINERLKQIALWGRPIITQLQGHPKAVMLLVLSTLLVVGITVFWPVSSELDVEDSLASAAAEPVIAPQYLEAQMPDGFKVMLDGDALLISWLGERGEPELIWSIATAKGDVSCRNITFNNGAQYRPLEVHLMADSSTLARFSPLDTQAIVNDIAMRGSLTLCGYEFSLKGSQAALSKQAAFRPYL